MSWMETITKIGEIARSVVLIQRRVDESEKLAQEQAKEIVKLREQIAALTTRVAVLEKGQETVAAQVALEMTKVIRGWENEQLKKEIEQLRGRAALPPPE